MLTESLGTAGLGTETILQLAQHNPAEIYFTGRNQKAADDVINRIKSSGTTAKITFVALDLLSMSSIKAAQSSFPASRLDVLICNGGIMAQPPGLSKDGYEIQFATNHLSHALLIKLLMPTLLRTADLPSSNVRIVILTSLGFRGHPKGGIVFKDLKTTQDFGAFGSWYRYGQSKLASILYASELARRYGEKLTAVSVHPGVINTGLVGGLSFGNKAFVHVASMGKMIKPHEGAYNTLWAATREKGAIQNGGFYEPVGQYSPKRLDSAAKDPALAKELWDFTEQELSTY